jgi:hypothetical protein
MREAALHRPVDWYGFPPYVPLGMRRSIPPKPPPEAVRDDVGASESLVAPEASEASVASVAVPDRSEPVSPVRRRRKRRRLSVTLRVRLRW